MARRRINVFGLAFLDAMTCGLGAVVLLFMVINASVGVRSERMTTDLQAEVDRLEVQVLDDHEQRVEVRNAVRETGERVVVSRGLARRIIEQIEILRVELATFEGTTLSQREHINRLQADLKSLEEDTKRYSGGTPSDETPGRDIRTFIGDGDRQYLTGLKIGGQRILILVDGSASMLGSTIVNIVRRRNLPDHVKIHARKWQQAVKTVDWLTTQIPSGSQFQIYVFNDEAHAVVDGTDGTWFDAARRDQLDGAVEALSEVVPQRGTSLYHAFAAIKTLRPRPDNVILLVDGLPTQGRTPPKKSKVSGKERVKLYNRALDELPPGIPINVILFPMEGDPVAASAFWKLAVATHGSYLSPSADWP